MLTTKQQNDFYKNLLLLSISHINWVTRFQQAEITRNQGAIILHSSQMTDKPFSSILTCILASCTHPTKLSRPTSTHHLYVSCRCIKMIVVGYAMECTYKGPKMFAFISGVDVLLCVKELQFLMTSEGKSSRDSSVNKCRKKTFEICLLKDRC